jgi:hypothetical protein
MGSPAQDSSGSYLRLHANCPPWDTGPVLQLCQEVVGSCLSGVSSAEDKEQAFGGVEEHCLPALQSPGTEGEREDWRESLPGNLPKSLSVRLHTQ